MQYNIGKTAKLMGISPELLRHYERKGIIEPERGENDYRFYDVDTIKKLSGIRRLRSFGFSLEDAETLIKAPEQKVALQLYQERLVEMKKELEWQQHMLKALEFYCVELGDAAENVGKCTVVEMPAMLWIRNCVADKLVEQNDWQQLQAWLDCMPVVRISPRFLLQDIKKKSENHEFGYVVELEDAHRFELADTVGAIEIKASQCISTVVFSENAEHIKAAQLGFVLKKAAELGFAPAGDAWGFTLGNFNTDNVARKYHRVYLPIKKK